MDKVNITIIGAGVIGLAVGYELSLKYKDVLIIEKNYSFGQEISSRNSEIIHAGIYYPKNSLKAKTCVEGKKLIYKFCDENNIPYKKIGKLIVASSEEEIKDLDCLLSYGINNGIADLRLISQNEIKKLEPNVCANKAIYSPSTGILDSYLFMKKLQDKFKQAKGEISYNTELVDIKKENDYYRLFTKDLGQEDFDFYTRILINCAGLDSDKIAFMAGIKDGNYKLKYCKGDYFRVHNKGKFINRLIYPVPRKHGGGLGVHATLDLADGMRLGPDDQYVNSINYDIDEEKNKIFYESAKKFLPFIQLEDLTPDTCGIRPKLAEEGEGFRDFIIKNEENSGLRGLINLIGIESPGLTAALSIAKIVKENVGGLS